MRELVEIYSKNILLKWFVWTRKRLSIFRNGNLPGIPKINLTACIRSIRRSAKHGIIPTNFSGSNDRTLLEG